MCRFLAYSGDPIFLDTLLIAPEAAAGAVTIPSKDRS